MYLSARSIVLFLKVDIIDRAITGNYLFRSSKQMYEVTTIVVGEISECNKKGEYLLMLPKPFVFYLS